MTTTTCRIDPTDHPLGHAVARALTQQTDALPHDISERLRAARVRAVAGRKLPALSMVPATAAQHTDGIQVQGGVATLSGGGGGDRLGFWGALGALIPALALVAGLVFIDKMQDDQRSSELGEVDYALLTDDLPPAAYTDPGFLQYLKARAAHPASDDASFN